MLLFNKLIICNAPWNSNLIPHPLETKISSLYTLKFNLCSTLVVFCQNTAKCAEM